MDARVRALEDELRDLERARRDDVAAAHALATTAESKLHALKNSTEAVAVAAEREVARSKLALARRKAADELQRLRGDRCALQDRVAALGDALAEAVDDVQRLRDARAEARFLKFAFL